MEAKFENRDTRTTPIELWARASTLAFMAWLPIIRALENGRWDEVREDYFHFHLACGLATLAADLAHIHGINAQL
jgi:hypothetical protein